MKPRWVVPIIVIYLAFTALGCSKKTDNTADTGATTPTTTAPAEKAKAEPRKPKPSPVVVPAGTVLTVSLGQAVGSKISQPGQSFSATLSNPVEVGGKAVIPAGASASGTVIDAKPLGRFKGGALLSLQLTSINVNGADRPIQTSATTQSEKGKGSGRRCWPAAERLWARWWEGWQVEAKASRSGPLPEPARAERERHSLETRRL